MHRVFKIVFFLPALLLQSCATFISDYKDFYPARQMSSRDIPPFGLYITHSFAYKALKRCDDRTGPCPLGANIFSPAEIAKAFLVHSRNLNVRYFGHESGMRNAKCSEISDCDIRFDFRIVHKENPGIEFVSKMVSLLSLTLIPAPFFVTYEFELSVFDKQGALIGRYTRVEKLTEWVQIGFLFVKNRGNRFADSRKILYDVVENMLIQVKSENIIKYAPI